MTEEEVRVAIKAGDGDSVRLYLTKGGDPNATNKSGMTLLMFAIWLLDSTEIPSMLLEAGADLPTRQPSNEWRAYHYAAVNGKAPALELLIQHGDRFLAPDDWKALHYAVQYRSYNTIPLMLDNGATIDLRDENGWTPLMRAAKSGIEKMVLFVLDQGADQSLKSPNGQTALDIAVSSGKKKAAAILDE